VITFQVKGSTIYPSILLSSLIAPLSIAGICSKLACRGEADDTEILYDDDVEIADEQTPLSPYDQDDTSARQPNSWHMEPNLYMKTMCHKSNSM
jgi:hypothetical protein